MTDQHRKKLHRFETPGQLRYATFSCYKRMQLLGTPKLRDVFVANLERARRKHEFRLLAWVVMPEHVHIMLVPRLENTRLDEISRAIKQPVATKVIARWRFLNAPILPRLAASGGRTRFWQPGGGFDRNVRDQQEFLREVNYIHMNPVRRGLAANPLEWVWSSAAWYATKATTPHLEPSRALQHYVRVRLGLPVDDLLAQGEVETYEGE